MRAIWIVPVIASILILWVAQSSHQATEIVFEENFDGVLTGWIETICNRNDPPAQVCSIGQATGLLDANEPAHSLPNWGFVEIFASGGGSVSIPIEVRYQKTFNVAEEDDYDISAWLGIKDCSQCNISTQLYIDGILVFERIGPDVKTEPVGPHEFFEQTIVHFTTGSHNVEIAMFSTGAVIGDFRASFDDILIQRTIPNTPEQQEAIDKANEAAAKAQEEIQKEEDKVAEAEVKAQEEIQKHRDKLCEEIQKEIANLVEKGIGIPTELQNLSDDNGCSVD